MTLPTQVTPTAHLIEVFSAIQGEGLNVGTRQIFIRFARCDLRCHFCDSAHTWETPPTCRIEQTPGMRNFETHSNPVPLPILTKWVSRQNIPDLHDSISITGGEPLLSSSFLQHFLPEIRAITGLPIYLETGGHRPQQLKMLISYLDLVGMDIKLPSVSGETRWQQHREFMQICDQAHVQVFVKIIISATTDFDELIYAGELVQQVNPTIPIFLQPVTPLPSIPMDTMTPQTEPSPTQVLQWQAMLKKIVKDVRVVPQTHKMLNQL